MLNDLAPLHPSWLGAVAQLGGALKAGEDEASMSFLEAYASAPTHCPRCASERLYSLSDGGRRCPACLYSFREHSGRWIGRHRLPAKTWLAVLRGFDLGLGVQELGRVAGLSMPTASRVHRTVQLSLAALDPAWLAVVRACAGGGPVPTTFAVRRDGPAVRVEVGDELGGRPSLELPPPREDDATMRRFRLALRRWRSLVPERLALTLKELELRANRPPTIFDTLVDALTRYMPAGIADA